MSDVEAKVGELAQAGDDLVDLLSVFSDVEVEYDGLLDRVVVGALAFTVLAQHVELVGCPHSGGPQGQVVKVSLPEPAE